MDTVIVGIDESDNSEAVLDFAMKEAALRGARLRILYVWAVTPPRVLSPSALEEWEGRAETVLARALEHAARLGPKVEVTGQVVFGETTDVLTDEAKDALQKKGGEVLLVVGSGLHGDHALPPVGHQLLHRAPCPVAIVRGPVRPSSSESIDDEDPLAVVTDYDLLSVAKIARLGKVDKATVERLIREDPAFPKPVARLSAGALYNRKSIYKWAIEAGFKGLDLVP